MKFIVKAKAEKPTPKLRARDRKMAEQGLRYVSFVVPIEVWEKFKALRCKDKKPNEVVNEMLRAVSE